MGSICNLFMDAKKFNTIYIAGLLLSTVFMILILLFWIRIASYTFLIFFWVLKFLSGFGIILSIANGFLLLLDKSKNKISKKGTNLLIIFQIIIPILFVIFALYNIISSSIGGSGTFGQSIFWSQIYLILNNLLYLYGIVSLLLNLYIIPIVRDQFEEAVELGKLNWWKKSAKKVGRSIKKKYFKLKKEFAKAQIQDQMSVKEILDLWRNKFAINLLLVFSVGSLIFTPITFVCVLYWLRLYVFFRNETNKYENIAMLVSMAWIGFIACILPFINLGFYQEIEGYLWTMNIFYLIGIILASWIFIKKLLNLQKITLVALKAKRKDGKIEKQAKEIEKLKSKLNASKAKKSKNEKESK